MDILKRLSELKAELDSLRPIDKDREAAVMQKLRLDWNFHSNHLEGNSLTYGETKALILFGITAAGKPLKDHFEMTGHDEAVKWIEEVVKEQRPLTENFIRQLHQLILKESYEVDAITPDGKPTKKKIAVGAYKTQPNHVLTPTGEIFRFATPEETPAEMTGLIDWYRQQKEDPETHPLLLAAEFHYRFIRIHPFDDGNGRTARILMNFILMSGGYPPVIVKTEDKQNYLAALRQADAGVIQPFIEYIGENLQHSLEIMIKGAKGEIIDEPEDVDKEIALIEQKFNSIGDGITKLKSFETIMDVYENSIQNLFTQFVAHCHKFDKFYNSFSFNYQVNGRGSNTSKSGDIDFGMMTNLIAISKEKTDDIRLTYNFRACRKSAVQSFNYSSAIAIQFEKNNYSILSSNGKLIFKKYYHEYLSAKENLKIITMETKAHTDFINQQIELGKKDNTES
jgi:cell filamentation protein, protein adenylyltransferase